MVYILLTIISAIGTFAICTHKHRLCKGMLYRNRGLSAHAEVITAASILTPHEKQSAVGVIPQ